MQWIANGTRVLLGRTPFLEDSEASCMAKGVLTKERLAIEVGQNLKGDHVVAVLKRIAGEHGPPKTIFCDNGFVGLALELWAVREQGQDRLASW